MIVRMKVIYEEVAKELGISTSVVESIGVEVLSTLREKLNGPDEIAYELPKLGTFTLKHAKYESFHKYLLGAVESGKWTLGTDYPTEMFEKNKILMNKILGFREAKANKQIEKQHGKKETNKSS